MLAPGTLLQNRYVIMRLLAQGGMGAVYLAQDRRLNTTFALKETFFTDERLSKAFEREAQLLARLRHSALPKVIDHFSESAGQFLVMEFIAGDDLAEMLKQRGYPFALSEVMGWGDQLLDVLDYLHTHEPPIIHRDIKPQNLKLTERGQLILLDFGLAKDTPFRMTRVTSSGSIFGYTPNYAPLEQIQGAGTNSCSDLYSLAATLYHLLTGAVPPDALNRAAALVDAQADPLRLANEIVASVPAAIATVLGKAMALSRTNRYKDAAEMRRALKAVGETAGQADRNETAVIGAPHKIEIQSREEIASVPVKQAQQDSQEQETELREDAARQAIVKQLIADGAQAFNAGQYALAIERWEAAGTLSPDEPGLSENFSAARAAMQKAAEQQANVKQLLADGARAFDEKQYAPAIEKWAAALSLSPDELGVKESIKAAQLALEKEAERQAKVKRLVAEGTRAFDAGAYDVAIQSWKEALRLSPDELGVQKSVDAAEQRQREAQKRSQEQTRQQEERLREARSKRTIAPPRSLAQYEQEPDSSIFSFWFQQFRQKEVRPRIIFGIVLFLLIIIILVITWALSA